MPLDGYKVITISEKTYKIAERKADKQRRSVANYVSNLIEDDEE